MTLVNWSPLRELDDLFNQYGRILGRSATPSAESGAGTVVEWRPVANISETADTYVIKAELPDMTREGIEVTVEHQTLTLRGTKTPPSDVKEDQYRRIERSRGSFSRSFELPATVDELRAASASGFNSEARASEPMPAVVRPRKVRRDC